MDVSNNPTQRRLRRSVCVALLALTAGFALVANAAAATATASFGIQSFTSTETNQDGTTATQAGSHPYESTTSFTFATDSSGLPTENVKDVQVDLPPGLVGDPNATPKCTVQELDVNKCPGSTQVGLIGLTVNLGSGARTLSQPLYNIVPSAGLAAQFGANISVHTYVDVVRAACGVLDS
jgi:hypothetical protein